MKTTAVLLLCALLGASGWWYWQDPLRQLERGANRQVAWVIVYEAPSDDTLYWQTRHLESAARMLGIAIKYGPADVGEAGRYYPETRTITINDQLHWTARFEVLAHELAHSLQPAMDPSSGEVFADGVSTLVALRVGDLGAMTRSQRYLSAHKGHLHVLADYRDEIHRVAAFLAL